MGTTWDPGQYQRYGGHRLRPALELLERIEIEAPRVVYDLGCGAGEIARIMAERWPEAHVFGVDSSEAMVAKARAAGPSRVEWRVEDAATFSPDEPVDVLYSNAMLHWIPEHREIFPHLAGTLRAGGVLAVQMPLSWPEPSHRLLRETLAHGNGGRGYGTDALRARVGRRWVEDADVYYDLLRPLCGDIDVWETRYLQVLAGADPVLEWVKGSGLRPVLDALDGDACESFLAEYSERLRQAYPPRSGGETLYPFPRLFLVARRGASLSS